MNINEVQPYKNNAKAHPDEQLRQLAVIVKEVGWRQFVMINQKSVIVTGHGRFACWLKYKDEYGLKPIWIMDDKGNTVYGSPETTPLTEEQERAYRIADNKLNESSWIYENVKEELIDLNQNGFDITVTGFDYNIILEEDENDDVVPQTPIEPKSKPGDVYELGRHIVICGDSTETETWQRIMKGRIADMVFTDPPYNVNYSGRGKNTSEGILNDDMDAESFNTFLDRAFGNLSHVTKAGAGWYVFHSTSTQAQFEKALRNHGLAIRNQLIWNKPTASMGWGDYRWKHEPFFYASKEGVETVFYSETRDKYTIIDFHDSDQKILNWAKKQQKLEKEGKFTIWTMKRDRVQDYKHPTQKPVELITFALFNSSKADDLIIDPFLGSGSTLIACEKTKRICAGIELDPKYVDVIVQRWVDYTGIEQVVRNGQIDAWGKTKHEARAQ
jgi:site-specific DNA-methyltransferase (adenine-specific)